MAFRKMSHFAFKALNLEDIDDKSFYSERAS